MEALRVGIIGCGRPRQTAGATGFGMGHLHARGYRAAPDARIVALADLDEANAAAFQAEHGGERSYRDYQEMLRRAELDVVSVCTWPPLHAEMVIAAAEAGVRAIHCEKPMAPTWAEALTMERVCADRGVQLTFNHQRRFAVGYRQARELVRAGAIGEVRRLEGRCGNLCDWGTHWFDLFFFYNEETPVEWVIGQVEPSGGRTFFGVPVEGQGLSFFRYRNGVEGLLVTGEASGKNIGHRLIGSDGAIDAPGVGDAPLRLWGREHAGWRTIEVEGVTTLEAMVEAGIVDLIDALRTGREPELSARRALRATELIFATYESSSRRGRVDLPLAADAASFRTLMAPE